MNLSPDWVAAFSASGLHAIHWSSVGAANADDTTIMAWALANSHIVLTHDLDFGTALALTHARGPSILQVRGHDVLPEDVGALVLTAIRQFETDLVSGAIVIIEPRKLRVRLLPL